MEDNAGTFIAINYRYPRPTNGIPLAMTVNVSTLALSGKLAM